MGERGKRREKRRELERIEGRDGEWEKRKERAEKRRGEKRRGEKRRGEKRKRERGLKRVKTEVKGIWRGMEEKSERKEGIVHSAHWLIVSIVSIDK